MKELVSGLNIFLSYAKPGEEFQVNAQHDQILAQGPTPDKLRPEHAKHLESMKWRWDATQTCWILLT